MRDLDRCLAAVCVTACRKQPRARELLGDGALGVAKLDQPRAAAAGDLGRAPLSGRGGRTDHAEEYPAGCGSLAGLETVPQLFGALGDRALDPGVRSPVGSLV